MFPNPVNILLWTSIIFVNGRIRAILVIKPHNITALIEGTVRFNCSTDSLSNRILWLYKYSGATRPSTIFNGSALQGLYLNRSLVDTNGIPGRYDLILKNIQPDESGAYICAELLDNRSKGQESAAHLIVYAVFKNLTVKPENTSAAIGSEVRLTCTSGYNRSVCWQHQPVGKQREDVFNGVKDVLMNGYRSGGRHSIDRDEATGRYDLIINEINRDDAGTYICIDEAGSGKETEAQLFVLEEQPKCGGNFSEDGILVENSCGLEPDVIILSCRIVYHGIGSPSMTWANATDDSPIQNSTCIDIGKSRVCSVVVVASVFTNWSEYVCKVSGKHTCGSGNVTRNVIYVSTSSSNSPGDDNSCHIKSSQPCSFSMQKTQRSNTSRPMDPVQNVCSAVCHIRGTECIIVRPVPVEDHFARDDKIVIVVVVLCVTALVITSLVFIIIVRRRRTKGSNQVQQRIGRYRIETTSIITGLTILDKYLYMIFANNSTIRVFRNRAPYRYLFEFQVNGMNPHDIISCPGKNKKLFVSGYGLEELCDVYRLWEIRLPFKKNHTPEIIIPHRVFENITSPCTLSVTPSNKILMIENITTAEVDLNSFCRAYFAGSYEVSEPDKPSSATSSPVIHMLEMPTDEDCVGGPPDICGNDGLGIESSSATSSPAIHMFAMPTDEDCVGKNTDICGINRHGNASGNEAHENESAANNEHEPSDKWYIANRNDKKICSLDVVEKKIIVHEFDHGNVKRIGEIKEIHSPDADIVPRLCCNDDARVYLVASTDGWIYEISYDGNYGEKERGRNREMDKLISYTRE